MGALASTLGSIGASKDQENGGAKGADREHIITLGREEEEDEEEEDNNEEERKKRRRSSNKKHSGETLDCPTCQGTGRIPRGQENKLVAVISCNDQRLKPRHTKCYVAAAVSLCLLASVLVLFFLFPRSIVLSPVSVTSVYVFFTPNEVAINITNILNITNQNFASVQAYNLTVQALFFETVVGKTNIHNVTTVRPRSSEMYAFVVPIKLTGDLGLSGYCKSPGKVHTLFLHLQMSMTVYYLAHFEQLSLDTFEYIDCGANSTVPHTINPHPP
ncbi:transmembrane protein 106B-like [Aplochiton taeniatus]